MVRMVHRIFQDQFPRQSLSSKIKHPGETWPESYGKGIFFGWFSKLEEKQAHKQKQQKNEHRSRPRFSGSGYVAIRWKRHKTIPRAAKSQRPSSSSPDVLLSSLEISQRTGWFSWEGHGSWKLLGCYISMTHVWSQHSKTDECDKPKHIIPCFFFSWPWLSMAFENSFGNFGYMEYGLKFALPQAHPAAESQLRRPTRFPSPHPSEHPSQPRYTRKPWWVTRIQTGKWRRNGCGEHTKHQAFEHNVEMKGNGSTWFSQRAW